MSASPHRSLRLHLLIAATLVAILGPIGSAHADVIDPANDFLATYTRTRGGDLDVLLADASLTGATVRITSTQAAAVGSTIDSVLGPVQYVWGFNRGSATTAPFAAIGITNVIFDAVVVLRGDGTGFVRLIPEAVTTNLSPSAISISGATISATFDVGLLPGRGFTPSNYTFNLWPRLGNGNNDQISDFAPDNSNALIRTVPEPSTVFLTLGGIAALGIISRRAARPR